MDRRPLLVLAIMASSCGRSDAAVSPPRGLVPAYLALASALAEDRAEPIAALAAELQTSAAALTGKPGIAELAAAAKQLSATDLVATRRAFESLSDGMVEYMRATPDTQKANEIVHCPMAFENAGALWVQAEGKIANPYFGASMLRCGNKVAWDAELPPTAD
jgi:Protein of unknown function (DUF3347)